MQNIQQKTGSGNKGLDWFIVLGMLAAYPKTADLLSLFTPQILNDLFGFDVSLPYGGFCALLVEGTVLFLHFDRRAHRVASAIAVKWILIGVSFACQIFDGFVTTDTVTQMTPALRFVLQFGIPALPLIISILIAAIGALPDEDVKVPFKGIKNMLPDLKKLWEGEENSEFSKNKSVEESSEVSSSGEKSLVKNPNGHEKETVNPTIRQP